MAAREHHYDVQLAWTGNTGAGTTSYDSYERRYELRVVGQPAIAGTADVAFRGHAAQWNPEELLVASLSACHQLWYLHLCADAGINVVAYSDNASGVMAENSDGSGQFRSVVLRPMVTITSVSDRDKARSLHHDASSLCFIARSMNFPVSHESTITVDD